MRRLGPAVALVLGGLLAVEIAYGAPAGDALLYLAYEAVYVVLPGCAVYRALTRRPGGAPRQLAFGWALGYVLEILAFMLTAATGTRAGFAAYPLVVLAATVAWARVRRAPQGGDAEQAALSRRFGWSVAAVCLAAVGYIGLACFPGSPLPGTKAVSYFIDDPRWIALAAEAKHHWPITEPSVSGQPLPYHYFVNIHMAGASQVTGIGLPLVYLRLYLLPMIVLLVLELVVAGRSFVRSARVGLAAAGLAIFVGQLRLDNRHTALSDTPFLGPFFTYLFRSPSFLFGLIIFVPLMALLGERLAERRKQAGAGEWVLIALLMVGASDAKVVILPVVLTALVLHSAVTWGIERRIPVAAWWGIGLTILVMGSVYVMQYSGHPSELRVHPLEVFGVMPAVGLLKAYAAGGLPAFPAKDILLSGAAVVFGLVGFLGPQLAGLVFMLRRGVLRVAPAQRWLMAMLGAALVLGLTFSEPGTANELYFVGYGLVAGCILSAEGLRIAWTKRRDGAPSLRPVVIAGVVWLVALAALMAIPPHVGSLSGPQREPHLYLVWYAGLLVALGVLLVAARRWLAPTWRAAGLIGCAAVVSVGVLDAPGIYLAPALAHRGTSVNRLFKPMSPELYRSLSWVRDRTAPGAVIAVNNQWLERGRAKPFEFDYSAFAERRVFLEGWAYSQGVRDRGFLTVNANPFPERLRLNEAAFLGDRRALAVMRRDYGVRYLLVDPDGGERADIRALRQTLRIVRQPPVPVFALR